MLDNLEDKITESLDNVPFIAKIFFWYEIKTMKNSVSELRKLRENYNPSMEWYESYGRNLNNSFNAVYNSIERAYSAYDAIKLIPYIGEPICSMVERSIGDFVTKLPINNLMNGVPNYKSETQASPIDKQFRLPKKNTGLRIVETTHAFALETLCMHYETSTDLDASQLRTKLEFKPAPYKKDPNRLRSYFIDALDSIGSFFKEAFEPAPYKS